MACATQTQFRRGTAAANATFTGVEGEVTYATDTHRLYTHDGLTVGGFPLALSSELTAGLALKLNLTGGTMSGAIAMGNHLITGVTDPSGAQDAATKNYVDTNTTNPHLPPIGSVLPWAKSITGVPALPSGWQECNGTAIASGPMAGQNTPNLNGTNSFPRGNSTSGGTGGAATHDHFFASTTDVEDSDADAETGVVTPLTVAGAGHTHSFSGTTAAGSSLPPYIDMVYIIRIF